MKTITNDHEELMSIAGKWGNYQKIIWVIFMLTIMQVPVVVIVLPMMQRPPLFLYNNTQIDREVFCSTIYYSSDINLILKEITIISEYINWASDLKIVCSTKKVFSLVGTVYFIASIAGYFILSKFPDRYGRKKVFLYLNFFSLLSLIQMTYLFNFGQILLTSFVIGLGSMNCALGSVIVNENIDGNKTALVIGVTMAMFAVGGMINTLFMYFFNHWIYYHLLITLLVAVNNYLGFKYLKESPKWLVANHKYEEYYMTILHISEVNRTLEQTTSYLHSKNYLVSENEIKNEINNCDNYREHVYTISDLFKFKSIRFLTFSNIYLWIFSGFSFYGILLNLEGLTGNIYIDSIVSYSAEFAAEIVSGLLADKYGRKPTIFWALVMSTAGCAVFPFCCNLYLTSLILFIICIGVASVFNLVYIYSAEMFPTNVKSLAVGVFFVFSRVSAGTVPYILTLMDNVVFIIFVMSLGAVFIISVMPETLNVDFGDEVREVKDNMYYKEINKSTTNSDSEFIANDENSF